MKKSIISQSKTMKIYKKTNQILLVELEPKTTAGWKILCLSRIHNSSQSKEKDRIIQKDKRIQNKRIEPLKTY